MHLTSLFFCILSRCYCCMPRAACRKPHFDSALHSLLIIGNCYLAASKGDIDLGPPSTRPASHIGRMSPRCPQIFSARRSLSLLPDLHSHTDLFDRDPSYVHIDCDPSEGAAALMPPLGNAYLHVLCPCNACMTNIYTC